MGISWQIYFKFGNVILKLQCEHYQVIGSDRIYGASSMLIKIVFNCGNRYNGIALLTC